MNSAFLIAAPMSGSGKTTVSRGLMALLTRRGYRVQPFKCGPDYIDTKFHAAVCGRPSVNLDTFMATDDEVRQLFARYTHDADMAIVEGMMGLYDGYDRDRGSSAEIARVLGLPVVLVVDARSAAYSMAPLLQGFVGFRPDVHVCGVIFNKVGSERHARMLRQVCSDVGLACLGCLPRHKELEQESRYLGLDFSQTPDVEHLVELMAEHVSWQSLLQLPAPAVDAPAPLPSGGVGRVVVARSGESFSFVYQQTLDALGPDVTFFNPESQVPQLDGADLLYLPGGYPEKHLEALAANEPCRRAISRYAERGGRVVAECGGMMYLCSSIVADGGSYPMCGVLPYSVTAREGDRRLSLGYRRFVLDGREYRGHEFHYTQFLGPQPDSAAQVYNAQGEPVTTPVIRHRNVLASYTHLFKILLSCLFTVLLCSCYNRGQLSPDAWDLTQQQLDSISFYTTHHYTQDYNFMVRADSMPIIRQLPAEAVSDMPVDTLMLYRNEHIVVADILTMPADTIDSVWVKVARDQLTFGWIHERDMLLAVSPDDPISEFIDFFSDAHLLIFLALLVVVAAAYVFVRLRRRQAKLVYFNDINSFYPTLLCLLVATSATVYSSIQLFEPEKWRHFYYHPTLNPYAVPAVLGLFLVTVWAILIVAIAAVDDVRRQLPFADAVLYLLGLGAACAVAYVVFSVFTLYYIGYPLLAAYYAFALWCYFRRRRPRYQCGRCGTLLYDKGTCPHCGALNV